MKEKMEFFKKATGGTTDSSLYAKGVIKGLSDILQALEDKK